VRDFKRGYLAAKRIASAVATAEHLTRVSLRNEKPSSALIPIFRRGNALMQILPDYMNSPEQIHHCLANAAECERVAAANALQTHVHAEYLHLARQWRNLASDMMALSRKRREA
jgi:hypothetical protein